MIRELKLKKLNQQILKSDCLKIYKNFNKAVLGEGPASVKIMFVGEAPGREEDKSGRPFVGRSGKYLTKLIEQAGFKRKNVFITSIIKTRPLNNRKPTPKEIKICLPWLLRQIEIINPKLVIMLGSSAAHALLGDGSNILKNHGKIFIRQKRKFFLTLHPAAALRFVKFKKIIEQDFRKLKHV